MQRSCPWPCRQPAGPTAMSTTSTSTFCLPFSLCSAVAAAGPVRATNVSGLMNNASRDGRLGFPARPRRAPPMSKILLCARTDRVLVGNGHLRPSCSQSPLIGAPPRAASHAVPAWTCCRALRSGDLGPRPAGLSAGVVPQAPCKMVSCQNRTSILGGAKPYRCPAKAKSKGTASNDGGIRCCKPV